MGFRRFSFPYMFASGGMKRQVPVRRRPAGGQQMIDGFQRVLDRIRSIAGTGDNLHARQGNRQCPNIRPDHSMGQVTDLDTNYHNMVVNSNDPL